MKTVLFEEAKKLKHFAMIAKYVSALQTAAEMVWDNDP